MPASALGTYLGHGLSPEGDTEVRLASALSRFSGLRPALPRPVGTHTHLSLQAGCAHWTGPKMSHQSTVGEGFSPSCGKQPLPHPLSCLGLYLKPKASWGGSTQHGRHGNTEPGLF